MKNLTLALPNKGRMAEDIRDLFVAAGLRLEKNNSRSLMASLGQNFEAIFVRSADIPEFVADGAADAGGGRRHLGRRSPCRAE